MWNDWDVTPPARMTGFLATLTDTQKEEALSYSGPDTHPSQPDAILDLIRSERPNK
jgi:hypothetical protein